MIPRALRRSHVLKHLGDKHPYARDLHVLGVVSSTSDLVLEHARTGATNGFVVAAQGQSEGRGRRGTHWTSPTRRGLWFSVLVAPPPQDRRLLSPAIGLAVADAIGQLGIVAKLKWPNDVFLGSEKVAGCLVDLAEDQAGAPFAVVGVGINTHLDPADLPPDMAHPGTSLHAATGQDIDREALLASTLDAIAKWLEVAHAGNTDAIVEAWAPYDLLIGRTITAVDGDLEVKGRVVAVDPVVGIHVDTGMGVQMLRSETTHVIATESA